MSCIICYYVIYLRYKRSNRQQGWLTSYKYDIDCHPFLVKVRGGFLSTLQHGYSFIMLSHFLFYFNHLYLSFLIYIQSTQFQPLPLYTPMPPARNFSFHVPICLLPDTSHPAHPPGTATAKSHEAQLHLR